MARQKSDRELEQIQDKLEYGDEEMKVFLADIVPKEVRQKQNMEDRMVELENLVNTYGGVVIVKHVQNKMTPDYDTFIGQGRLDEIILEMKEQGANLLIIGNALKAKQILTLNEQLRPIGAKAWDRVDLILKIFERNAKSAEAKLQIELAAIKHMGPRIYGMGMELSKQGGGVGSRGKGETNTEIMKRHLRKKEEHLRKELDHYSKVREQHRKGRARKGMKTVGVVGYTNAGKSTLTNFLTSKGVLAEDKLFATLGTSVGKMFVEATYDEVTNCYIPPKEILINDTIGFIRELPPKLVDAFSSTLEDSIESDILLHVVDSSDPKVGEKIQVVEDILEKIGANQKRIYVFNKIDAIDETDDRCMSLDELKVKFEHLNPIFVSVYKEINMVELKKLIINNF